MKNQIDMLIFHKSYLYDFGYIVPQASQSSHYRRTESEIQFAIPLAKECLRNGGLVCHIV